MEWNITYARDPARVPPDDHSWELLAGEINKGRSIRFVMKETSETLELSPLLADRPIVTSPRIPLYLPPREKALLFVGSPLWLRMTPGEEEESWPELPIKRPNDTWFGGSTTKGELCYSIRTRAVLNADDLRGSARSAITPVLIHNQTAQLFQVERLKIPVGHLSLYSDPGGLLWTDQIAVTNSDDSDLAQVRIERGAPAPAGEAALVSPARDQSDDDFWSRMFAPVQWFQDFTKV